MSYTSFFETLSSAGITDVKRASLRKTLTGVFKGHEEDKEERTIPPNRDSFEQMITFLETHPELPVPAVALNPEGLFVVDYSQPDAAGNAKKSFHVTFHNEKAVDEIKIDRRGDVLLNVRRREAIRPAQIRVPKWAQNSNQVTAQP